MKHLITILFALLAQAAIAQVNLVPNGSFEEYSQCPDDQGQIDNADEWSDGVPAFGSEYFNNCSASLFASVPQNALGFQQPHSGNAYAGFFIFVDNSMSGENLQVQLTEPLIGNKKYCIEFYISLADKSSYYINNLGFNFTTNQLNVNVPSLSIYIPQYINNSTLLNDSVGWVKVSGDFIALGGEKYLTISNFQSFAEIDTVFIGYPIGTNQKQCYFYIDDVSVYCCDTANCEILSIKIPNIFTPNGDQLNETFKIENLPPNSRLTVYSRWGNVVYSNINYGNNWDGELNSDGVYYYILILPSGESKKGTVTILRGE